MRGFQWAGCTIVAKNRLAYARVLARSFRRCHPDIPFFVLLADAVQGRFDPAAEPFTLVEAPDLGLPQFERFRFHYPQQPFSYACTPFLIAWLLARGIDRVIFLKQETLVLDDLTPLAERLGDAPIVLTPHLIAPLTGPGSAEREITILQSGVYNGGVLGVAAHERSARFLAWWQDRLRGQCRHEVEAGLHFEQRWLDFVPAYVEGAQVLRDPAYNLGHWSLPERRIDVAADGSVRVDGRPCRVFRFSGYRPEEPRHLTGYHDRLSWEQLGAVRSLVDRFRGALEREGYVETSAWPYAYGAFDNGVPVPDQARRLYLALGEDVAAFGDPLRTAHPDSFWRWLHAPAAHTGLTRFWHAVYLSRPDLQQSFPALDEPGSAAFMRWARLNGLAEHQVPEQWLEPA